MAKPNYAYEKRQRELAKKQKKEEKAREKADRKTNPGTGEGAEPGTDQAGVTGESSTPPVPGSGVVA